MDAFEVMGMGRGLCLGQDVLGGLFDRKVGEQHPDAGGEGVGFARMREAYEMLRSPGRRLRHWLELEGVEWEGGGEVPAALMDLFGLVGDLLQRVDGLAVRMAAAKSALGRSMLEREGMGLVEEVEKLRKRVGAMRADAEGQFAGFEEKGARTCAGEAQAAARTLLFLEKWDRQLRDRWAGLAG